ncbi:energy-coupling factor ABC transporter ATP-binding protein [Szabonella alba]|uniref:ABC transporter ATP-binding protein n=1 Tax=Szabonella alba TaxID=2804194 RepID=A0A8K0Y1C2_9RHOB|nr:ABC transporter ATP-binding protein [Szabonella alba]MBL4917732.1 ABC transporter ATP-binding protein [Szabonella alba]
MSQPAAPEQTPPGPERDSGILLEDVGLRLAGREVLSNISLHLTERRIAILGRNGSGKTSLLRVIAGLIPPTTGWMRIDGQDPATKRRDMLRRIGILFQNPDHQIIFPTVAEELCFGLIQQGLDRGTATARMRAHLAAQGRAHWEDRPVTALSQGQRQMLCLMAVLLMEPATILLDEPFAGLDLPSRARLRRRLAALPQQIITITHDPAEMTGHDRAIWIEAGRVQRDGPADAVAAQFVEAMNHEGALDADADLAP